MPCCYRILLLGEDGVHVRRYGMMALAAVGDDRAWDYLSAERFAAWFGRQWGQRTPCTWNVSLDAVRSAVAYWQQHGWTAADPSRMLARRMPHPDRARALSRRDVEQLLTLPPTSPTCPSARYSSSDNWSIGA
jgi:site-specific recombinase XerD